MRHRGSPLTGRIRAVVFDLDGTLYPERTYRLAAYRAMSRLVARHRPIDARRLYSCLVTTYDNGANNAHFQCALREVGIVGREADRLARRVMLPIYRHCRCRIRLYKDVPRVLETLRSNGVLRALVTNGSGLTQWNKIRLLRIRSCFESIIVSGDWFPKELWKPNPAPFLKAFGELGVQADECLIVGNDPRNDILGGLSAGASCLLTGPAGLGAEHDSDRVFYGPIDRVLELIRLPDSQQCRSPFSLQ